MQQLSKIRTTNTVTESLISSDEINEISMGINAEAIAHITARLTDLYTDPIAATVRETMSNAYDATVQLPVSDRKPIEVSLPSPIEPNFVVEDFGVGMSPEIIRNVYTQYGSSTKKVDFSSVGAFGLGAKAPLSYCNEFTVTSTRDGVTTILLLERNENGNLARVLSEELTNKPNGTRIVIPVRNADIASFIEKTKTYQTHVTDVPIKVDDYLVEKSLIELGTVKIFETEKETINGRLWVNPESSIEDIYNLQNSNISVVLSGWQYSIFNNTSFSRYASKDVVFIELKPGIVDFSSSRDEILVNDRFTALKELILEQKDEFSKRIASDFIQEFPMETITSVLLGNNVEFFKDRVLLSHNFVIPRESFVRDGKNLIDLIENSHGTQGVSLARASSYNRKNSIRYVTKEKMYPNNKFVNFDMLPTSHGFSTLDLNTSSLIPTFFSIPKNYSYGNNKSKLHIYVNTTIIDKEDTDPYKKVKSFYRNLTRAKTPHGEDILFFVKEKEISSKDKEILDLFEIDYSIYDFEEEYSKVSKSLRKATVNRKENTYNYSVIEITDHEKFFTSPIVNSSKGNKSIDEIMNENDIIIVGESLNKNSSAINVLIDMANTSELDPKKKYSIACLQEIYAYDLVKIMKASYPIYFHKEYKAKSPKINEQISKLRRGARVSFYEALNSPKIKVLSGSLFNIHENYRIFKNVYETVIEKNIAIPEKLQLFFDILSNEKAIIDTEAKYRYYATPMYLNDDTLKKVITQDEIDSFKKFVNAYNGIDTLNINILKTSKATEFDKKIFELFVQEIFKSVEV